jgi:hypothetical protein
MWERLKMNRYTFQKLGLLATLLTLIGCAEQEQSLAPVAEPSVTTTPPPSPPLYERRPCDSSIDFCLPITGKTMPRAFTVVYEVELSKVKNKQKVLILAWAKFTNQTGFNVMVACKIKIKDDEGNELFHSPGAHGYNITPSMHHGGVGHVETFTFSEHLENVKVQYYCYALSTAADRVKSQLYLETHLEKGSLDVLVIK